MLWKKCTLLFLCVSIQGRQKQSTTYTSLHPAPPPQTHIHAHTPPHAHAHTHTHTHTHTPECNPIQPMFYRGQVLKLSTFTFTVHDGLLTFNRPWFQDDLLSNEYVKNVGNLSQMTKVQQLIHDTSPQLPDYSHTCGLHHTDFGNQAYWLFTYW